MQAIIKTRWLMRSSDGSLVRRNVRRRPAWLRSQGQSSELIGSNAAGLHVIET
jgi:hypothetical protein